MIPRQQISGDYSRADTPWEALVTLALVASFSDQIRCSLLSIKLCRARTLRINDATYTTSIMSLDLTVYAVEGGVQETPTSPASWDWQWR